MYLGEIARHVLVSLIDAAPKSILFSGKSTKSLNSQWGFDTSVMSDIELAWGSDGEEQQEKRNPVPSFIGFDEETLPHGVKTRLEAIRDVLVTKLGLNKEDVSLLDASVRFSPSPLTLPINEVEP